MKYNLTTNKKKVFGRTLYQIKAVSSFGNVKKGDLGGWIEKETNLSQEGGAWVSGDARVYGAARVSGAARVHGAAWVYGAARVSGKIELNSGYYFGTLYKGEKLVKTKMEDGVFLIGKK